MLHSMHRGVFLICKPKPSARRRRVRRILLRFLLLLIIVSAFLEFIVKEQLSDVIAVRMQALAQRAVNAAVADYLAENPGAGESLTTPHYGSDGTVVSITSDPAAVNRLKTAVSELSQDYIDALTESEGISVPLGSFTGFVPLTNLGPEIRLDIGSRQTVICSLNSTFESGGVNQTLHHVVLTVDVGMAVYNPFRIRRLIHTSADFEIAQTVIVGDVPSYALGALR